MKIRIEKVIVYTILSLITVLVILAAVKSQQGQTNNINSNIDLNAVTPMPAMDHSMHNMDHSIKDQKEFITQMIPHHEEAVKWSQYLTTKTSDADLQSFTSKVVIDQQKEIDMMKQWYLTWYGEEYKDNGTYMPMMSDLSTIQNQADADRKYIEEMIGHHEGAVDMAEQVLKIENVNEETKILAQNIINTQTSEIEYLKSKLNS